MASGYRFQVLGPFPVPVMKVKKRGRRLIDFENAREQVFSAAEEACKGKYEIRNAVGCYAFGLSPSGGARTRPYYIGQACRRPLSKRLFEQIDKPKLYNDILNWFEKAAPFVYLLPLLTPSGALAQLGSNKRRINLAEQTLIGMAMRANPDLWNIQHRMAIESFSIDGVPEPRGRQSAAAKSIRAMLDRSPPKKVQPDAGAKLTSPDYAPEELASVSDVVEEDKPIDAS